MHSQSLNLVIFNTFQLREDLGGVQYVPTFLVVFFGDDGTYRAKYERIQPIREALERYIILYK